MTTPNERVEPADELSEEQVTVPVPPRFEVPADEPAPWSVPPPGGFAELRAQLFRRAS